MAKYVNTFCAIVCTTEAFSNKSNKRSNKRLTEGFDHGFHGYHGYESNAAGMTKSQLPLSVSSVPSVVQCSFLTTDFTDTTDTNPMQLE
jgi:hypothetical protein